MGFIVVERAMKPNGILLVNQRVIEGDLLEQDVEVIVNAWNRNIIPWWLLLPQGVSGVSAASAAREDGTEETHGRDGSDEKHERYRVIKHCCEREGGAQVGSFVGRR
jgi:hypothetical protein